MKSVPLTGLAAALGMESLVDAVAEQQAAEAAAEQQRIGNEEIVREQKARADSPACQMSLWDRYLEERHRRLARRFLCVRPPGYHTVESSTAFPSFFMERIVYSKDESCILVPDQALSLYWDFDQGVSEGFLLSHGWEVIHGLNCNRLYPRLGNQLVLPFQNRLLLPPYGLWEHDLPSKVKAGEFVPGDEWEDIFVAMQMLLAGPAQWIIRCEQEYWLRLNFPNRGEWRCHASLAGLNALLKLLYNNESCQTSMSRSVPGRILLRVPKEDAGIWIGKGGCRVKQIASSLSSDVDIVPV